MRENIKQCFSHYYLRVKMAPEDPFRKKANELKATEGEMHQLGIPIDKKKAVN